MASGQTPDILFSLARGFDNTDVMADLEEAEEIINVRGGER